MKFRSFLFLLLSITMLASCVSKKKFADMKISFEDQLSSANMSLDRCERDLISAQSVMSECENESKLLKNELKLRQEQIGDLKDQLEDVKVQRDKQLTQVGDLTVLSTSANENIKETLSQLEKKDKYIQLLYEAKNKEDSINLALAFNLKSALADGIDDKDVEVKVDKTVVFVNLSDKMLYQSGSAEITSAAHNVLAKIATIIESRPELEVMVEGYTDNVPIKTSCLDDNWDLSVKRATSVVRVLQKNYGISPDRLIAAGRGEFLPLVSNDTPNGRSVNRRTRIVILPKLGQFYDLLNPANVPE